MNFGSDNASGVHPRIMAAMAAANDGHAASYGRDDLTARAQDRVREVFDAPDAQVFLLGTGTGANAIIVGGIVAGVAGGLLAFLLTRPGAPSLGSTGAVIAAIVGGLVLVAAGLYAEHLCTIRKDDDDDQPGPPSPPEPGLGLSHHD